MERSARKTILYSTALVISYLINRSSQEQYTYIFIRHYLLPHCRLSLIFWSIIGLGSIFSAPRPISLWSKASNKYRRSYKHCVVFQPSLFFTIADMSPNSDTSSIEAQNGSAYRYCLTSNLQNSSCWYIPSSSNADFSRHEPSDGTIYPAVYTAQARRPPRVAHVRAGTVVQQPTRGTRFSTNGYQHQNGYYVMNGDSDSYIAGDQSQSVPACETSPASGQNPEPQWGSSGYLQEGQYYLPTTPYDSQTTPTYNSELIIDSIEEGDSGTWGDDSRYPRQSSYREPRSQIQQTFTGGDYTRQDSQTANIARTPTTRRWSREYSPEERMRVGLPRWESEQHRIDYEGSLRRS